MMISGVGYDSTSCDENAVCAANTVVAQNSYCQCITSSEAGYSGNTFISDGPSNEYYAASTDTCHVSFSFIINYILKLNIKLYIILL